MSARRLFEALFALSLFTMAVRETLDTDMWWHLRTGQVIVDSGIPRQDIFSFTVPDHRWITHEWLSEVVMWLGYQPAGLAGLILLFAGLTAVTFWLVYLRCAGRPYLAAFIALLAAIASAPFWGVRPQLFNMLGAALFVFLVEGFRSGQIGRKMLWLLPLITLLWANLHSGYLLGLALLGIYLLGDSLQRAWGSARQGVLDWPGIRWLGFMAILSFLIAALNPNGPELWIYPFFTLGSQAMQRYILEWHSPDFHQAIFWPFAGLLALGLTGFIAGRQRPTWTDVLLFGGTAAAGLLSARHMPLFAIVSAPIIARSWLANLEGTRVYPILSSQATARTTRLLSALNWLILLALLLAAVFWSAGKLANNRPAIAARFPVAAVDYLEENGLADLRGYNSYNWGGYLIWRGLPVFVDGRADVYGDDFLFTYRQTYDLTDKWQQPLSDYDVDYILIEQASPLANLLSSSPDWRRLYDDDVAAVFVPAGS